MQPNICNTIIILMMMIQMMIILTMMMIQNGNDDETRINSATARRLVGYHTRTEPEPKDEGRS